MADGGGKEENEASVSVKLTDSQRARIERNRQKALLLKQARIASRPYSLDKCDRYVSFFLITSL